MKTNKRSRWIVLSVVLFASLVVLLTQVDSVRATFNNTHVVRVFLRVQSEVMQKTPAGQYYESMFWKHNDELIQIMYAHPEHTETFTNALVIFVPELDALLNGDGDKAFVTLEHVESFRSELDWFSSMGSSALQDDIRKEQERIPLGAMIGMNMNEALDFVNLSVSDNSVIENKLVPDSDGMWAYYFHGEVYFEYPASFSLQISESDKKIIYLIPSSGSPDHWNPCVIRIRFLGVLSDEIDTHNPRPQYPVGLIMWEDEVQNVEFPGIGFVVSAQNWSVMDLHAFQYNEENQLAVETIVLANENPQLASPIKYSKLIGQRYEYFQHVVDSLEFQVP